LAVDGDLPLPPPPSSRRNAGHGGWLGQSVTEVRPLTHSLCRFRLPMSFSSFNHSSLLIRHFLQGIIHRDLNEKAIFFTADGQCKLGAFEHAALLKPKSQAPVLGTPAAPAATPPLSQPAPVNSTRTGDGAAADSLRMPDATNTHPARLGSTGGGCDSCATTPLCPEPIRTPGSPLQPAHPQPVEAPPPPPTAFSSLFPFAPPSSPAASVLSSRPRSSAGDYMALALSESAGAAGATGSTNAPAKCLTTSPPRSLTAVSPDGVRLAPCAAPKDACELSTPETPPALILLPGRAVPAPAPAVMGDAGAGTPSVLSTPPRLVAFIGRRDSTALANDPMSADAGAAPNAASATAPGEDINVIVTAADTISATPSASLSCLAAATAASTAQQPPPAPSPPVVSVSTTAAPDTPSAHSSASWTHLLPGPSPTFSAHPASVVSLSSTTAATARVAGLSAAAVRRGSSGGGGVAIPASSPLADSALGSRADDFTAVSPPAGTATLGAALATTTPGAVAVAENSNTGGMVANADELQADGVVSRGATAGSSAGNAGSRNIDAGSQDAGERGGGGAGSGSVSAPVSPLVARAGAPSPAAATHGFDSPAGATRVGGATHLALIAARKSISFGTVGAVLKAATTTATAAATAAAAGAAETIRGGKKPEAGICPHSDVFAAATTYSAAASLAGDILPSAGPVASDGGVRMLAWACQVDSTAAGNTTQAGSSDGGGGHVGVDAASEGGGTARGGGGNGDLVVGWPASYHPQGASAQTASAVALPSPSPNLPDAAVDHPLTISATVRATYTGPDAPATAKSTAGCTDSSDGGGGGEDGYRSGDTGALTQAKDGNAPSVEVMDPLRRAALEELRADMVCFCQSYHVTNKQRTSQTPPTATHDRFHSLHGYQVLVVLALQVICAHTSYDRFAHKACSRTRWLVMSPSPSSCVCFPGHHDRISRPTAPPARPLRLYRRRRPRPSSPARLPRLPPPIPLCRHQLHQRLPLHRGPRSQFPRYRSYRPRTTLPPPLPPPPPPTLPHPPRPSRRSPSRGLA